MPLRFTRVHRPSSCTRPWNSGEAETPAEKYIPIHFPDKQEDIDKCMNCPLPSKLCHGNGDCYVTPEDDERITYSFGVRRKRGKFDYAAFVKAHEDGLSNAQIALAFQVTKRTVRDWNRKYGYNVPVK